MASRIPRRLLASLSICALVISVLPPVVGAAGPRAGLTATQLTPVERITAGKSLSSRLAQTDPKLLARTDSAKVRVMIKVDYDATASYAGGIKGLAATSPMVTGKPLTGRTPAERSYDRYATSRNDAVSKALKLAVPSAAVGQQLRTVYGGFAAQIPANAVERILQLDGVVAVQYDQLEKPLTDSSPEFLNATSVYDSLGTTANAGAGLILGNLDTGIWPEHPSFADLGNLSSPPGPARECDFGDNPLTPAVDPFVCNDKLIGGAAMTATYDAVVGDDPFAGTARDGDGHGTHTASTSAGNIVEDVSALGRDLPAIHGMAPGAWVMEYKVCGPQGCYSSDSAAAVGQAIVDGVNAINFSISGGASPYTDPVELAFLDAYNAGVFVSASAGNSGPGAGTTDHLSPWVTTVAASTQTREFSATLNLTADNSDTFSADGATITAGAGPLPVVLAQNVPGYTDKLCGTAPPNPEIFDGLIVACQRGTQARVWKGFVVHSGGGAGMVLYNPSLADTETDNHWLPTVHLADGTDFLAFMNSHTGVTGSFAEGQARAGQGDVMAAFSSRGPAGLFIKPDVTAPGVQILAGASPATPTPNPVDGGSPPGNYFQAIAGTSMSSPHVAGAALLVKAVHPTWTPGQIKSALMTTAITDVVKEDLATPADPFDMGAGRIDIGAAAAAPLTLDESASDMFALGGDPLTAVHLNIPSIDAPVLPGRLETTRVVTNATRGTIKVNASASAPAGSKIAVSPSAFTLPAGKSQAVRIVITTDAAIGEQQFGAVTFSVGRRAQHLPVAFIHTQGAVSLNQSCAPTSIARGEGAACQISATNNSFDAQVVNLTTTTNNQLQVVGASGATVRNSHLVELRNVALAGAQPGVPSLAEYGPLGSGYLALADFGFAPEAITDEQVLNFDVPAFWYNGQLWTSVGVDSNGYLIVGGGSSQDNECCTLPSGPDPSRPNNVLAPFWTDLDGTGAPGIYAGILSGGGSRYLAIEYQVNVWGTSDTRVFQVWIGLAGDASDFQDISFNYGNDPADPNGQPFLVGAENVIGQGEMSATLPATDLIVESTDPIPGDSATYQVFVNGAKKGSGLVTTEMTANGVPGTTIAKSQITVK